MLVGKTVETSEDNDDDDDDDDGDGEASILWKSWKIRRSGTGRDWLEVDAGRMRWSRGSSKGPWYWLGCRNGEGAWVLLR